MSELNTLYQVALAGLGLVVASFLYSLGGRDHYPKAWRRYGGSFIISIIINIITIIRGIWSPWFIATYPLLIGAFSLGYGGDEFWFKFMRRAVFCAAVLMAGVLCAVVLDAWPVFIFQCMVAVSSIFLGLRNPVYAAAEEFFVCFVLNLGLLAYPFVV